MDTYHTSDNSKSELPNNTGTTKRRRRTRESKWDIPDEAPETVGDLADKSANDGQKKRQRRLYVGNLPPDNALDTNGVSPPISKTEIFNVDQGYCFLEFSTAELADMCFKLDGINYKGQTLKIRRPIEYGTTSSSDDTKVFVQNIPPTMSDADIKALLEKHGKLTSANLVKDLKTGQNKGYGFFEFDDSRAAKMAVCHLNGHVVDKHVLSVKHAAFSYFASGGKLTDSKATNLPNSVTQTILSNPLLGLQMQSGRRTGAQPSRVVQLLNIVFHEDLIHDRKYHELKNAIIEEAKKYGHLEDVVIPRPNDDLSYREGVGKVFLKFGDDVSGRRAQYMLNGRVFDRKRVVCAAFFPLERFTRGKYTLV
ncbi:RNA recognition motif (RRM)-containing protein, putative [Babesia bigemina]|uniref:RNA recognition motif (RRM)-containing protein, putative n=1 Tax=Babesia bigemina TaxID=5866 RepID=A0A061D5I2_BABBI|nr:RNA recognition motif (RRM)-containing protein, putative [Babesia bigemina]CDR94224.1 RNA recognition motif (RRM)-containing protein, putative [Babesia bigemina]|eukprot:XP_012766410.1 RNA recognition motif (RRM)-containing protein, putative [Babesia bigemina]